jgi:hypothetical protein
MSLVRNVIGQNNKWQQKQGADYFPAHASYGDADNNSAPRKKEPSSGIIPRHRTNVILSTLGDKVNRTENYNVE